MSRDVYEFIALSSRYVFTLIMLIIVLRAIRGALVDSRRAAKLRRLSPMTGLSGELVVLEANQKIPRGMRYPVIREGMIGSSTRADIRIRHASVRRRHALFELTSSGLHIRTHAGARLRDSHGMPVRDLTLLDGDSFFVGAIRLHLVLSAPDASAPRPEPQAESPDDLFTPDTPPVRRAHNPDPVSPIFETEPERDDVPLYARPRGQRVSPARKASRRAPNPVSPIFDDEDPYDRPAPERSQRRREFMDDDDDLFSVKKDRK